MALVLCNSLNANSFFSIPLPTANTVNKSKSLNWLAGANRMRWGRFLFWNALGGIAWTHLYGITAYILGAQAHKLTGPFGLVIGTIAALVAVAVIWFLKKNERRLIDRAMTEMDAHDQAIAAKKAGREPTVQATIPDGTPSP